MLPGPAVQISTVVLCGRPFYNCHAVVGAPDSCTFPSGFGTLRSVESSDIRLKGCKVSTDIQDLVSGVLSMRATSELQHACDGAMKLLRRCSVGDARLIMAFLTAAIFLQTKTANWKLFLGSEGSIMAMLSGAALGDEGADYRTTA